MFTGMLKKRDRTGTARWYVRGPLAALAAAAVLLYGCSLLLSKEIMPSSLMSECALLSVFLGAAAGGAAAARVRREGVLTAGALTGAIMLAVLVLIILLRPTGKVLSDMTLKTAICALGGGTFGGALCLKRPSGKRHKRTAAKRK